ncbi:MAG: extracellular solute-binding protein [Eubacteriales bacterium]|nr:extracellular solute-binding protein [Eubacteriales bacterium]
MKKTVALLMTGALAMSSMMTMAAAAETADQEPVTIRFAWWGSQARNDQTQAVVELFEETYPWITVECEFVGWDEYWDNLSTQIAAGQMPDILQHDYRYLETYVNKGLLHSLDEYVGEQIDLEKVDESSLSGGKVNGELYGIPLGMNTFAVQYDEDTFAKYGVEVPDPGWTYEDFKEVCGQFKEQGIYGCDLTNFEDWVLYYVRSRGATLYSQDGVGLGYEDDAIMEEIFQMRLDLVTEGLLPTPDVANQASGTEDSLIVRGDAAMVTYWSNATAAVANATEDTIKVLPMFGPDSDKGTYIKPSMFASISAATEHPEECALLIDFFTNNVEANKIMMGERGVPISSEIREALLPELDVTSQAIFELLDYSETHSSPINNPDPEGAGEVVSLLQELEEQVLYEQMTPAEAAAQFREEATEILTSK